MSNGQRYRVIVALPQPVKVDLSKKLDSKQKTIQPLNIDVQGFKKQKMKILWHGK